MALLRHTTTTATGTTIEEWDVDPVQLAGLGIVSIGLFGGFVWIRRKVLGRGR